MIGTRSVTASRSAGMRTPARIARKAKSGKHRDPSDPTTPERRQHGVIARAAGPVADVDGNYGTPYIARDLLATMEARGTITSEMRVAGDKFREDFRRAHLDEMRAADLNRVSGSGQSLDEALRTAAARSAIHRARKAVGEPGGSILWNVVGLEQSLKDWALGQNWNGREINPMQASGILVATLGMLAARTAGR